MMAKKILNWWEHGRMNRMAKRQGHTMRVGKAETFAAPPCHSLYNLWSHHVYWSCSPCHGSGIDLPDYCWLFSTFSISMIKLALPNGSPDKQWNKVSSVIKSPLPPTYHTHCAANHLTNPQTNPGTSTDPSGRFSSVITHVLAHTVSLQHITRTISRPDSPPLMEFTLTMKSECKLYGQHLHQYSHRQPHSQQSFLVRIANRIVISSVFVYA